jgi:hypothetical protein
MISFHHFGPRLSYDGTIEVEEQRMSPCIVRIKDHHSRCHQVDLNMCRCQGLANPPAYFAKTPTRIGDVWLEEKLGVGRSLEVWQMPSGTWLVVDQGTGDGVAINEHQFADLLVGPQTTTTTGPPTQGVHPTGERGTAPVGLRPDEFDFGAGRIVSEFAAKQLTLLRYLHAAGRSGVPIHDVCKHLEYRNDKKGWKALASLVARTQEKIDASNAAHLIEMVNCRCCLTPTDHSS